MILIDIRLHTTKFKFWFKLVGVFYHIFICRRTDAGYFILRTWIRTYRSSYVNGYGWLHRCYIITKD